MAASNTETEPNWHERWQARQIGFHEADVNNHLQTYEKDLFPDDKPRRVFVPMAGKTVDIPYLASKGHTVVAVEYVEQALVEFFQEQQIKYVRKDIGNEIIKFEAADGLIQFYQCDFFNPHFNADLIGPIERVWDRGSLIAMKTNTLQPRYVAKMKELLTVSGTSAYHPELRYLLYTVEYPQEEMSGPPFCITEKMVGDYFSQGFDIKLLGRIADDLRRPRWNLSSLHELDFMLTPKAN
eukprot:TRINITY_DN1854_c0_g1_i1.p1 TRINITY_DN1854_c0_g1~~TRINITY_DN1854_c0_g1_i1.p1  ORF type:complete len:239 (+),score=51.55 TRINITY_DN1854_c0_g1_i1:53-769(+)